MRDVKEIGGEFEFNYFNHIGQKKINIPNTFHFKNSSTFSLLDSGRSAIKQALLQIRNGKRNHYLLPSYLCESMVKPFIELGLKIEFYKINSDFSIDLVDLQNRVTSSTCAVLVNNYFSSEHSKEDITVLNSLKKREIIILEDITHQLLNNRIEIGDILVASVRKWFSMPTGGILIYKRDTLVNHNIPEKGSVDIPPIYSQYRAWGFGLKHLYINKVHDIRIKNMFQELFQKAEEILDSNTIHINKMDILSEYFLHSIDVNIITEKRKQNYSILYENLCEVEHISFALGRINNNIVPLGFPILCESRDELKKYLIKHDIYPPVHWALPNCINVNYYNSHYLSNRILTIVFDKL
ncbi:hypothetical protein, partial [Bacillus sp. AFS040349]|uniref:hypothetical protein n=1 Tax=Bacillus sp. AFS040349 TaxID=2033502 RepID=UPI000BFE7C66